MNRFFRLTLAAIAATVLFSECRKDDPEPVKDLDCLYFEAVEPGVTLRIQKHGGVPAPSLEYSTDGIGWKTYDFSTSKAITLDKVGDRVYWRNTGKADSFSVSEQKYINFVLGSRKVAAGGNVMSLIDKSCKTLEIPCDCAFLSLFAFQPALVSAPSLPATTLTADCYWSMFRGCTGLTDAPELPAETLAPGCYSSMFDECSSLVNAPECLPADKAEYASYKMMFNDCTSLKKAPKIEATVMGEEACYCMFYNCTSLTDVQETLPADKLGEASYAFMYSLCSSLAELPELPATTLAKYCYQGMFQACSATSAPRLPATELAEGCYDHMFCACNKLNYIEAAFSEWPSESTTMEWLEDVAAKGTFVCPSALPDLRGISRIPEGWDKTESK